MSSRKTMPGRVGKAGATRESIIGALLGAAIGDSMGWPFEGHADKMPRRDRWPGGFIAWNKKAGGRFRPYLECIGAGEYSDDTQLILAVARSRLNAANWWSEFSACELPFWTAYERGGGGATKRAATSWLSGEAPWRNSKDSLVQKYLEAGGNGVAMRILPHAVLGAASDSFEPTAIDIMTDGVTTHGHPRALLGALAYGFALWYVLRITNTLRFGELVDSLSLRMSEWAELPSIKHRWSEASHIDAPNYAEAWRTTAEEMKTLLMTVRDGLDSGALASDEVVLKSLGALDNKTKGAGTVSAAVAVYFASRYAASPLQGLRIAATSIGSDTDTVASMTGALLGALVGTYWLDELQGEVQDREYLTKIGSELANYAPVAGTATRSLKKGELALVLRELITDGCIEPVRLPNGLNAVDVQPYRTSELVKEGFLSRAWKVRTLEGMTLFIRSPSSLSIPSERPEILQETGARNDEGGKEIGISLSVASLHQSRTFYERILGLEVSGETSKTIRFGNNLALRESVDEFISQRFITLFLHTNNVAELHSRMVDIGYPLLEPLSNKGKTVSFECRDPDGYLIEVYERRQPN